MGSKLSSERKRVRVDMPGQQVVAQASVHQLSDSACLSVDGEGEEGDEKNETELQSPLVVDPSQAEHHPDHQESMGQLVAPSEDAAREDGPPSEEQECVWSTMVEIDPGFPFDVIWPELRSSVYSALRHVQPTWPQMGWRNGAEMEESLRQAIGRDGAGAIARGLQKAQAEHVAHHLQGAVSCSVRLDREGAAAATMVSGTRPVDDGERRSRIRQQIRDIRENGNGLPHDFMSILQGIERDVEDEERWRMMAPAMERTLDRLQACGPEMMRLLFSGRVRAVHSRVVTIGVNRDKPLASSLGPLLRVAPEDLRPGSLRVKYRGEEGEDGEGGGGVTRVFLTQVGRHLAETEFGLLLPAAGGHFQLNPLLGFLSPLAQEQDSVFQRPDCWSRYLGRLLGMAVVHECPLGLLLVPPLCKQLLGEEPSFDDLQFVPGLSDGGVGWYSSLKAMLAHRAPDLVKADPALVHMDTDAVNGALFGLEAVMPSKAQMTFESLASYVGGASTSPQRWEGATGVTACLLREASTEAQQHLALRSAEELLRGITSGGQPCGVAPRSLRRLDAALRSCSGAGHAEEVAQMLQPFLADDAIDCEEEQEDHAARRVERSDLDPMRPQTIPGVATWFTTGAKTLMRQTGRFYHEIQLDDDFFDDAPQLGFLTDRFTEQDFDGNGVGDDVEGWAADGVRHLKWHNGQAAAAWPRRWLGGDVIGFAIDIEAGQLMFSLNGEWADAAAMTFEAQGRAFFPAASMKGQFEMHIPSAAWHFAPPDEGYQSWAESGVYTRPVALPAPVEKPSLARQVSQVESQGFCASEPLSASNIQAFAEAVARKALTENLQPHLDLVTAEFRSVVPQDLLRSLSWEQVQDRISGQRLDPAAFVHEWREKTTCDEGNETVARWWSYVSELPIEDLLRLFAWCTGFAAIPVTAWKFQIKVVDETGRCPTVNTCMTDDSSAANRGVKMPTMYLPAYSSKETMAQRIDWALAGASTMNLH